MRVSQLLLRLASGACGLVAGIAALLLPFDFIYTVSAEPADQLGDGGRFLAYGCALLMFAALAFLSYVLFRLAAFGSMFPLWRR